MSRLPPLRPEQLQGDQQAFYQELSKIIDDYFGNNFTTKSTDDSSFIGPFGIFMHSPTLGRPFFAFMLALSRLPSLSAPSREVAILTTGAHFQAAYELYAHTNVALQVGLSSNQIQSIRAGIKPGDLDDECSVAYDVAVALVREPDALDGELYDRAVRTLGSQGMMVLVQIVGYYSFTCVLLNGFAARVPDDGART